MHITCPSCGKPVGASDQFCTWCGSNLEGAADLFDLTGRLPPGYSLQSRYMIERLIGHGGMGAVYKAVDTRLAGKECAIKEMSEFGLAPAERSQAVQNFEREAHMLAQLQHSNLPQVADFFQEGSTGRHYLVMDFIEGRTLEQLLIQQGGPFPETQVRAWALQLCEVLSYLHSRFPPIVFRDLKPGNIMVEPSGQLKLIDFGIARLFQTGRSGDTQSFGTYGYSPPEQYGHGQTDARSDVYSLGVTLLRLATDHDPSQDPFNLPSARQVTPTVSPSMEKVIQRATQAEPNDRFQTARELCQALDEKPSTFPWTRVALALAGIAVVMAIGLVAVLGPIPLLGQTTATPSVAAVVASRTAAAIESNTSTAATPPEQPGTSPTATEPPTATTPEEVGTVETDNPTEPPPPTPTTSPTPTIDLGPETITIGRSVKGEAIEAVRFGAGPNNIIFIGGLHAGFAPSSVSLAQRAVDHFRDNPQEIPVGTTVYVVLSANPDSEYDPGELIGRFNANGVDINRNWDCNWAPNPLVLGNRVNAGGGPAANSEPETRSLRDFFLEKRPVAVVFWGARATNGLVSPGSCEGGNSTSASLAEGYGLAAGYRVEDFEALTNQELNGDATNWLDQQSIPAITVLTSSYTAVDWSENLAGIRSVLADWKGS